MNFDEQVKGFNAFSSKSSNLDEFALDYHSIGFRECASEVEKYLSTQTNIDHMIKERVISHLKKLNTKSLASRDQIKDNNNNKSLNNLNNKNSNSISKKKSNNNKSNKQDNSSIKLNNHINNLHNLHNNISLFTPLSPPSSSVSPLSTSSSSSITTTSSNSLEASDFHHQQQMYIPYALLKSKKLPFNLPTTLEQINSLNNSINLINKTYKPNENQLPLKCL